jgi:hypothetical protein
MEIVTSELCYYIETRVVHFIQFMNTIFLFYAQIY